MWKWEADEQAKAVIVIVHSAYEHHLRYAWLIEQWRSAGFHVIMDDLPGHGSSMQPKKPHDRSFSDYEESVKLMLEVAQENELPVFLIAHGLGATLALNVLEKQDFYIAGAVLTSPWLHLIKTPSKLSAALSGIHRLTAGIKIEHGLAITDLTRNPEVIESEKGDKLYQTVVTAGWYRNLQMYMKKTALKKTGFPDIPLFVQTGELDQITDKEYAKRWLKAQELKEFSYKEWSGCNHDLFQEPEREDIFATTQLFIKSVLRSLGYIFN